MNEYNLRVFESFLSNLSAREFFQLLLYSLLHLLNFLFRGSD